VRTSSSLGESHLSEKRDCSVQIGNAALSHAVFQDGVRKIELRRRIRGRILLGVWISAYMIASGVAHDVLLFPSSESCAKMSIRE
jgi:hypothetical protein